MDKRLVILISIVLAVGAVVTGVLYAQEKGNISTLKTNLAAAEAQVSTLERTWQRQKHKSQPWKLNWLTQKQKPRL